MKYPVGDPDGPRWRRVAWALGWRLVPTRTERRAGVVLMLIGAAICAAAVVEVVRA